MHNLFIKERHLKELLSIFEGYCPKAEIWAYGSRVGGNAHDGSDLDLAIKNFNDETKNVSGLKKLLEDSSIPFLTDIFEFDDLPESFQREIEKNHTVIFPYEI